MSTKRICLVTNELHPIAPGGIGRMMYNFLCHIDAAETPVETIVLLPRAFEDKRDRLDDIFDAFGDHIRYHVAPDPRDIADPLYMTFMAGHDQLVERVLSDSMAYYQGLREIEQTYGPLSSVEFPDFKGWAYVTLCARQAEGFLAGTEIAVRLHSTQSIIYAVEKYAHHPSAEFGLQFDYERFCLAHCDLVIGHVPAVIAYNREFYGFGEDWLARTRVEMPPITPLFDEPPRPVSREVQMRRFVFASRYQHFKRPDIYIAAALEFIQRHPERRVEFFLAAYGWETAYIHYLQSMIPTALRGKIELLHAPGTGVRHDLILNSTAVIPSDYESLCLLAFECSLASQRVILNAACPAFDATSLWKDGENCWTYDGTIEDLVAAMERSYETEADMAVVDIPAFDPHWEHVSAHRPRADRSLPPGPVPVYYYGLETGLDVRRLPSELAGLAEDMERTAVPLGLEVVLCLPAAHAHLLDRAALDALDMEIRTEIFPGNRVLPERLGDFIVAQDRPWCLLWHHGLRPTAAFLRNGVIAMTHGPRMDFVGCHQMDYAGDTVLPQKLKAYAGSTPSFAVLSGRVVPRTCLVRGRLLAGAHRFDSRAGQEWPECFFREAVIAGADGLILPMTGIQTSFAGQRSGHGSKFSAAALMDRIGRDAGTQVRLIGADPVMEPMHDMDLVTAVSPAEMRSCWPRVSPVPWAIHEYSFEYGGFLLHGIEGDATVGRLDLPPGAFESCHLRLANRRRENEGAFCQAFVTDRPFDARMAQAVLDGRIEAHVTHATKALWLRPGARGDSLLSLVGHAPMAGIHVAVWLPPGASSHLSHVTVDSIELRLSRY